MFIATTSSPQQESEEDASVREITFELPRPEVLSAVTAGTGPSSAPTLYRHTSTVNYYGSVAGVNCYAVNNFVELHKLLFHRMIKLQFEVFVHFRAEKM